MSENRQKLEIKTLGTFSACVNGVPLAYDSPRAGLVWKLFKYIITNRTTPIPTERIIDVLWPEDVECDNPLKALYTLVYRLRGELSRLFEDKQEFLIFRQNTYTWNKNAPFTLDVDDFEHLYKEGSNTSLELNQRLTLYLEAFALYGGDYLAESSAESWVLPQATYLKRMYTSLVSSICEIYKQLGDYAQIVRVCERAIEFDPFEESHHAYLIEALTEQKQLSQALAHYEYISLLLYNELGIQPSERLQTLNKLIHQHAEDSQYDLATIMDHLSETENVAASAFFCDLEVFHKIYQLENRAIERSGEAVYLACMMFTTPAHRIPPAPQLNDAITLLKKVVLFGLRRGDVVTQYSKSQLLVMLPGNSYENCEKVLARLKKSFLSQYKGDNIELQYTCKPIPARQ